MNRVSLMLVVALIASPAFAGQDVESELAEMRALVEGLKEKVEAQDEQLAHQGELLEQAQDRIQSEDDTKSTMDTFVFPTVEDQLSAKWLGGGAQEFMKGVADVFVAAKSIDAAKASYADNVNTGPLSQ